LAASRHLCPHLSIQLQGSKEHWGQSPPYGKFLATPLLFLLKLKSSVQVTKRLGFYMIINTNSSWANSSKASAISFLAEESLYHFIYEFSQ
jgi:hypothetical protein